MPFNGFCLASNYSSLESVRLQVRKNLTCLKLLPDIFWHIRENMTCFIQRFWQALLSKIFWHCQSINWNYQMSDSDKPIDDPNLAWQCQRFSDIVVKSFLTLSEYHLTCQMTLWQADGRPWSRTVDHTSAQSHSVSSCLQTLLLGWNHGGVCCRQTLEWQDKMIYV